MVQIHLERRTKRTEQFYFGKEADDPKGERAISDPVVGWLARRAAILEGVDNIRVQATADDPGLGELMNRFLIFKRNKVHAGELSLSMLHDYIGEVEHFVTFLKPSTPAGGLRPEHFSAYMMHLIRDRKLGRHARKRVRGLITAFLRFGAKNAWYVMPNTGTDWVAPATDPDSIRQAKTRAGVKDYSDRILTGEEIDQLLLRAPPTFKALILLGINTGMGPADLGRLTWDKVDLDSGRLIYPRPKTGAPRVGFLWKKTRQALLQVRILKHNRAAVEQGGDAALVFLTRTGRPFYVEKEIHSEVKVDGKVVSKLTGVALSNTISGTFTRMVARRDLKE